MPSEISGVTAIVTGASRGFGRAIATSLAQAGARVVGVARDPGELEQVRADLGGSFLPVAADATDPTLAGRLVAEHQPAILVLNAGASPQAHPIQHHTWKSFSQNWQVDVQHAFHWIQEALLAPLPAGSTVITLSSGAALRGSPLSGGYAGSKATIRFITSYAGEESRRAGLGIRFASLLPALTPATTLGAAAVAAYAARAGMDTETYLKEAGSALTARQVGDAVLTLVGETGPQHDAYVINHQGLAPAP